MNETTSELHAALSRHPDPPHPSLQAWDATDELLLSLVDLSSAPETIAVDSDRYGALALALAAKLPHTRVRVYQDLYTGVQALENNRERLVQRGWTLDNVQLSASRQELYSGSGLAVAQLPKSLAAAGLIGASAAKWAQPEVEFIGGARLKYWAPGLGSELAKSFAHLEPTLAWHKSRALRGHSPLPQLSPARFQPARRVQKLHYHGKDFTATLCAEPETFGGAHLDDGSALLLSVLPGFAPGERVHDLGCGNGSIALALALANPEAQISASDVSRSAVASTRASLEANGVAERVQLSWANGLRLAPEGNGLQAVAQHSLDSVVLNPPFHQGGRLDQSLARELFRDARRALRPGGKLYTVWNSHLKYAGPLKALVGPTTQLARTQRFTVSESTVQD